MDNYNQGNNYLSLGQLVDYRIIEPIYSGSRTLVYRAIRISDQLPVVIKLLKNDYPSFNELAQFRNQYNIAKKLNSPHIVQTYGLEPYQNGYGLVMEDFGGIPLQEWMRKERNKLSLPEFLKIAIDLCNILDILYQNRIIHKDIKPSNILINPETKQVKLIDFSIASLLPRETQSLVNPNVLEGTLAYISPEQTGRMNRGIDYRTDFYSLGISFYELLTGELPFKSGDVMELVHSHIAKSALLVHEINTEIPPILSQIIQKLMAKNAEDRYQSALGLKFDLENCLLQLVATGKIEDLELGQRDVSDRFLIPDQLYGRETEVASLLKAFDRVSAGATEMMLVAGFSGIGKTAVVNEVHKPIARQRGYFIKGKYDQFQHNIPFSAFVQAFRDLMEQLLTESDAEIHRWQGKILAAVGENGQIIIEVIPELAKIIGEQPTPGELSGAAAQNRFNLVFQKFTQVFTSAEHPLVIFLDDLQWADAASLKLIQLLMTDPGHLLLIGAYRDNEVDPGHPFLLTLREIQKSQATVNTITLLPLNQDTVNQLVADTLKCPENLALPLAQLVYQKTQGNPFFATQFLKTLQQSNLIQFNSDLGYWRGDIEQIHQQTITNDIVAFMALQLDKLPPATQQVLQLAACMGNRFDLETLAIVWEHSELETAAALWQALEAGLILPIGDVYRFYIGQEQAVIEEEVKEEVTEENSQAVTYKFLHDRVQQAAYSSITDAQKLTTHLKIGQLLLHRAPSQPENLFEIVNQLDIGRSLIIEPSQQLELAQLNLNAGKKAKDATAYVAALEYATTGITLLDRLDNPWQSHYNLTLTLHELAAEATYLSGNFEQIDSWADLVLAQAKTAIDKMKVYAVKIQGRMAEVKKLAAVEIGLEALTLVGVNLPKSPKPSDIQQALNHTAQNFQDQKIEDLFDLPVMTDPEKLAASEMLASVLTPVYQAAPTLLPLITCELMNLSLYYGNSPFSTPGYAFYGMLLNSIFQDIDAGYQFGQLAIHLAEKFNDLEIKAYVFHVVGVLSMHSKVHLRETLPILWAGYESGLEGGNFEHGGISAMMKCEYSFLVGQELSTLAQEMAVVGDALVRIKQENALRWHQISQQTIENLLNPAVNSCCLEGEFYQETTRLPRQKEASDRSGVNYFYVNKLTLCYLFGEYQQARENALQAEQYLDGVPGVMIVPVFYFYDSLTHLAIYPLLPEERHAEILDRVTKNQEKMRLWADHAPMNFQHKFDLVVAEQLRILGHQGEALAYYDQAIALAKKHGYVQEEALAHELAAKFYLSWGKQRIAQEYMTEAYYGYTRWGAKAKVADLESRYPQLLAPILQQPSNLHLTNETVFALETFTSSSAATANSHNFSVALDLATILKASQALASEIRLDKLLAAVLEVVIENAGADKCVLILQRDAHLLIKGTITVNTEPVVLQNIPIEDSAEIPLKLIYKIKHNRQTIVLIDATADPTLATDPYILNQQPKSILCSPILYQKKLLGILYLENNLTTGAFTSDRVELLNLICTQVAISLENARLYEQEQQKSQALEEALNNLQNTQLQLVQGEKMSALGNLVAGVAHEMNNPLGFISASLTQLKPNFIDIVEHLKLYQESLLNPSDKIKDHAEEIDLEYSLEDLPKMIDSMTMACNRLKNISTSLRTFSRADRDHKVLFYLYEGIDSTILILKHRLKANDLRPAIKVVTNYGDLPQIKCFPGQLNQVFMNILANAIDALEESNAGRSFTEIAANPNKIIITTTVVDRHVQISVTDNGKGMSEEVKNKVFDHLFTTKEVGKGTGLGLAIARQIIEEKHQGTITVNSTLGKGTEFIITLPIK